ncbi:MULTISPECIES: FAD-binding oxidoreductase [unclassified Mesorhizobium]|uniref:NAD(P)/FAD-dependent oxidoreductase n=1 Tax=unclassified Mesorhizobium TaxID=325217 RepID=UPI001CD0DB02|nr:MULTISPECIES: FAD-binding oxidoreductase [unclassified Mesorhizobium]MCA0025528.1 FAD-dependent oxidoreductase [Mesorhizobium sp. B263B1A]
MQCFQATEDVVRGCKHIAGADRIKKSGVSSTVKNSSNISQRYSGICIDSSFRDYSYRMTSLAREFLEVIFMRVVVIGSGIVGSSAAYECAKAGASVVVLEAGRIAGGTSAVSFAWTNATTKQPRPYFDLNVSGMRAHLELKRDFGVAPWFTQTGSFDWRTVPESMDDYFENFRQMKEWGYGVEWIEKKRVAEMEPDIDVSAFGDCPISYYPEEGWVDPVLYSAWLLRAAKERWGAQVKLGSRVTEIETESGRVRAVRTANGDRHPADAVVSCTGGWSSERLGDAQGIPLSSTIGVLAFTPPVALTLRSQLHADDLDIRPDGAGRIMIHKVSVDMTLEKPEVLSPAGNEAATLLDAATKVLSSLRDAGVEAIRTTVRPFPEDGYTCAGAMPDIVGHYMAVTHSGVTIGPQLGKVVADEVVRGKIHDEMETFRPQRFFQAHAQRSAVAHV